MQENGPYSAAQIRSMLVQYLDGALGSEQMAEIDGLIERYPHYKAELLKLQAVRGTVHESLGHQEPEVLQFSKVSDQAWKNIARQLEEDSQAPLLPADPEFISAYYDHEIHTPTERQQFEAQLFRNDEANRLLADIGQISETVRQFGYRLEESCTLDITARVMGALAAEQQLGDIQVDGQTEMLSAFFDQQLTTKETMEATRLIESDPSARRAIAVFSRLSEQIHSITNQIQEQAPDLWPQVKTALEREPAGKVLPFGKRAYPIRGAARIAIPVAAAAVLLLFLAPGLLQTAPVTQNTLMQSRLAAPASSVSTDSMDSAAPALQANRMEAKTKSREIATVPVNYRTSAGPLMQSESDMAIPAEAAAGGAGGNISADSAGMSAPAAAPMLDEKVQAKMESRADMAAAPMPQKIAAAPESPMPAAKPSARAKAGSRRQASPSSEEYLFKALSEQMPNEDISTILGQ